MAKEICISSTPHETRLAILEDDQLAEIYYERENEYTLAGSIYNGRVTRVLPGMQSAFVDVGLERDAFLYVTDFLELEDQEETDELEKAAVSGGNQAPREVRHTPAPENGQERNQDRNQDRNGGRQQDRAARPAPKPEQEARPERQNQDRPNQDRPNQDRPARDRRPAVEAVQEATPESITISEQPSGEQDESGAPGAKRWRGRRRRRGGRGDAGQAEGQPQTSQASNAYPETSETSSSYIEEIPETEPEVASEIYASAVIPADVRKPRTSSHEPAAVPAPRSNANSLPVPFVLPGESLSKYGGTSADSAAEEAAAAPAPIRPASTYKPSTLIEAPFEWDGSGLMPGESLSRHRAPQAEPAEEVNAEPAVEVDGEPHGVFSDASETSSHAPDQIEEQEFVEEVVERAPEPAFEQAIEQPSADEPVAEAAHEVPAIEAEPDADASHNMEPAPPSGFRLFGLGKKKAEEEAAKAAVKPVAAAPVSTYAPGSGFIEEELIEEEEFDAPHHHHGKVVEQDLEDFEEETLPTSLRTGDLGEMLQEAHLDHRIQLNFDDKNGEEGFDDDEEEEEPSAEGQPAPGGNGQLQPRRDRGGRGRRGRGGAAAPSGPGQNKGRGPSRRSMQTSDLPIISDLLKPGQEILVQIAKEPIAKKGARITSHIALPGRFLVFMPTVSHVGVSRKIASDDERQRLKRILVHERGEASGGFIVRTAAEGASEEDLRADLRFLLNLWNDIKQRSDSSKSPALIYHDLSLIERILRDQVSSNFSNIWVDSEADYERIVRFLNRFSPTLVRRVKLYTKEVPLFEHFGIQDEISKALRSKVWLKSGGSIVINQTEALVAIDINTGKYVGKSSRLEDTIVKTNMDAVPEIVRQIRLRDLGGIIVIDFIDMDERKNRFKVLAALEEALKSDRAPTKVLQFNDFGLVAITRKRVKQSLERTLSVPCPTCQATGMVKSPTTVCNEIYTELRKMKKHFEGADVLLRVNPETVKVLKSNNGSWLTEFEELVGKNILIKSDATLHPEQFDIQG
jgi:ribonuclease G